MTKIQTLPNIKGAYQNFKTLKDKIKIDPNFVDVSFLVSNKIRTSWEIYYYCVDFSKWPNFKCPKINIKQRINNMRGNEY